MLSRVSRMTILSLIIRVMTVRNQTSEASGTVYCLFVTARANFVCGLYTINVKRSGIGGRIGKSFFSSCSDMLVLGTH